jgi:Lhr-like helicase
VVATGSLELGIDIGAVDGVILAGTPAASATALQRLGRSGHGVGETSRGRIIPFHGIPEALKFLTPARSISSFTNSKITVETINGKSASRSEYAEALKAMGFLPDRSKLILW